jgi:hypothetical protein
MKSITESTLKRIDESNTVKGMLADDFGRSHQTIQRWIDDKDPMLCHISALDIYKKALGINIIDATETLTIKEDEH